MRLLILTILLATTCLHAKDPDIKAIATAPGDNVTLMKELTPYPLGGPFVTDETITWLNDGSSKQTKIISHGKSVQGKYVVYQAKSPSGKGITFKIITYDRLGNNYVLWLLHPEKTPMKSIGNRVGKNGFKVSWKGMTNKMSLRMFESYEGNTCDFITSYYAGKKLVVQTKGRSYPEKKPIKKDSTKEP